MTSLPTAIVLRDSLRSGELTAMRLAETCLGRIDERDEKVRAWAHRDSAFVRRQAAHLDELQAIGTPLGPLHGMPVGLKDIIDTVDFPTENGCILDRGRAPAEDALIVRRLKEAGAVIVGKTITTELAFMHPGPTRNPHTLEHTPGGSSSGSAAAVADGMVPLTVGTQTGGSVIRPASFCGVVGFKPTFGAIPTEGVLKQSPSLDTVGVFASDPVGAGMLASVLSGVDMSVEDQREPAKLAFVEPPFWDQTDPDMREGLSSLATSLGGVAVQRQLPQIFESAEESRRCLNFVEMAHHFAARASMTHGALSDETLQAMVEGSRYLATEYVAALDMRAKLNVALDPLFDEVDAIVCPASLGPAPRGLGSTGNSIMNGLWTLAGTPCVSLPILTSGGGLPMGVQLVGKYGSDKKLLSISNWLWQRVRPSA